MGFERPTPIQADSIPPALAGRDILACAATGSGKTAAFLLPILQRLLDTPQRGVTRALVLTPTRELAAQIVEHFDALARHTKLRAAAVYGGVGMNPQVQAFRRGVDLIVACPGRLLDHFQYDYAHLDGLEVLVLDEVDRMLDMGFLPDVKRVLGHLPDDYDQALFFSATLPKPIVELTRQLLDNPAKISIERRSKPAAGITQALWPVHEPQKKLLLLELLEREHLDDVLVFTRTKHRANRLAQWLEKRGISADRIHGNRSQAQRTRTLADFKAGKTRVLVATDIAARGIDVEQLSHVVNFDVPHVAEDYIHRVGRTARAGATGDAYTFVTPADTSNVRAIERAVGHAIERRRLDGFDYGSTPDEALEIPVKERIARHRAQRQKSKSKAQPAKGRAGAQTSAQKPASGSKGAPTGAGRKPRRRRRRRGGKNAQSASAGRS
ncbi:MAG: DEAD/DEAH box helicase [Acidobacteriota bacterium]